MNNLAGPDESAELVRKYLAWMAKQETDLARWQTALLFALAGGGASCDDLDRFNRFSVSLYGHQLGVLKRIRAAGLRVPIEPPPPPLFSSAPLGYNSDLDAFVQARLDCTSDNRPDLSTLRVRRLPPPCPPVAPLDGTLGAPALAALCLPPNYAGLFACLVFASIALGGITTIGRQLSGADRAQILESIRHNVAQDMGRAQECRNKCFAEQWASVPVAERSDTRAQQIWRACERSCPMPPTTPSEPPGLLDQILSASWKVLLIGGLAYGTWRLVKYVARTEERPTPRLRRQQPIPRGI